MEPCRVLYLGRVVQSIVADPEVARRVAEAVLEVRPRPVETVGRRRFHMALDQHFAISGTAAHVNYNLRLNLKMKNGNKGLRLK